MPNLAYSLDFIKSFSAGASANQTPAMAEGKSGSGLPGGLIRANGRAVWNDILCTPEVVAIKELKAGKNHIPKVA